MQSGCTISPRRCVATSPPAANIAWSRWRAARSLVGSRRGLDELNKAARAAGVRFVAFGGIHKMSTLVQWAKIQIADMDQDRIVFDRLVTFRGDTDESRRRAEHFVAAEIAALSLDGPGAKAPAKLAVFDFELQDSSGGAGIIAESAEDAEQLKRATLAARKLIAELGPLSPDRRRRRRGRAGKSA